MAVFYDIPLIIKLLQKYVHFSIQEKFINFLKLNRTFILVFTFHASSSNWTHLNHIMKTKGGYVGAGCS